MDRNTTLKSGFLLSCLLICACGDKAQDRRRTKTENSRNKNSNTKKGIQNTSNDIGSKKPPQNNEDYVDLIELCSKKLSDKIRSCEPYKCLAHMPEPFGGAEIVKEVIGLKNNKCEINDGLIICTFSQTERFQYAEESEKMIEFSKKSSRQISYSNENGTYAEFFDSNDRLIGRVDSIIGNRPDLCLY